MAEPRYRKASGPLTFVLLVGGLIVFVVVMQPSWERTKVQSRAAECPINLEIIADRQEALKAERGAYLGCPRYPATVPEASMTWESAPSCWTELGFEPDVFLWGQYAVDARAGSWSATCTIDTDGDGDAAVWTASSEATAAPDPAYED